MESFKFTKSKIETIPPAPQGKQVEYADTVVNGLRLRVGASGIKSFCVSRKRKGKFIRATLGRFPELTVDNARAKALEVLGEVAITGINPNEAERTKQKLSITLRQALNDYISNRGHRLKEKTAKQYISTLTNFSGDWLDNQIASITRERVELRHKAITEGTVWFGVDKSTLRSGVGVGSSAQADLWGRALRAVCRFAHDHYRDEEGNTILPDPPTKVLSSKRQWHGLTRKTERIRNHDLGRWLVAVDSVRAKGVDNLDTMAISVCDALKVALFTGLRRSEIFGLKWDRVNLAGRYFWIDKTKNGDPLELPITDTLLEVFRNQLKSRYENSLFVFPNAQGNAITDPRRVMEEIVTATAINNNQPIEFKCHDARRTFGSIAELVGVGSYILKRLMNHRTLRSADVTQGYLHFSADELREPAEKIEREILKHAGLIEDDINLNKKLFETISSLSDSEKRKLLFALLDNKERCSNEK
ncbi:MAG: site-specific integrase [Providencia sp.]|jgi:integrase|nr:site-specific integrase [Providencia sp.]